MVETVAASEVPELVRARLVGRPGTRWVGIDGFGASGKTTLAAAVAAALPGAVVVHIDDFSRPWLDTWDRDLFARQLLEPLLAGRAASYRRWDLVAERAGDWVEVPVGVPVVVEGVSSTDVRLGVPWDLTIWVDVAEAVRRQRIAARDPVALLERWERQWWPAERAYAAEQRPAERTDVLVV